MKNNMNEIDLTTLPHDILVARAEVSLASARSMEWMAKHYQSLGLTDGMKYCAQRGVECLKEYNRVTSFLNQDKTAEFKMAA